MEFGIYGVYDLWKLAESAARRYELWKLRSEAGISGTEVPVNFEIRRIQDLWKLAKFTGVAGDLWNSRASYTLLRITGSIYDPW